MEGFFKYKNSQHLMFPLVLVLKQNNKKNELTLTIQTQAVSHRFKIIF